MKKTTLVTSSLIIVLSCLPIASLVEAQSSTRYVSDVLYIPLRSGMGNNYEVVKAALTSGTRLTAIRQDVDADNNEWTLVRTSDGDQGWIRSQFLLSEPTAAVKLERMETQLARAKSSVRDSVEQQKQFTQLQDDYAALKQEHEALLESTEQLRQASESAVDLEKENQRTHENNQLLQTRVDVLQAENAQLRETDRYNQWLYGAAILICGIFVSFLLQAFGKRKRQSEWR